MATSAPSCSKKALPDSKEKTLYTCGMHPQVIQDQSRQLPDLRHEADADPQTAGAGREGAHGERKIKYYKSTMMLRRDQPDAAQGQHGHGHGAGL